MRDLSELLERNREWAEQICEESPDFFLRLCQQQSPRYLWIGCSDSRVPANQIVGLLPGELFVHRNIANVVVHTDLNCLSVIQFAVEVLKVSHIIVCGHYGCSGVYAAYRGARIGLADNWLRHVRDVRDKHESILQSSPATREGYDLLCELNVIEQVVNVSQTTMVQDAWAASQPLAIHGWIYGLHDGRLRDLGITVGGSDEVISAHAAAIRRVLESPSTGDKVGA